MGGIGSDYVASGKCSGGQPAAFMKLHGMTDPFITYDKQVRLFCFFLPSEGINPSQIAGCATLDIPSRSTC